MFITLLSILLGVGGGAGRLWYSPPRVPVISYSLGVSCSLARSLSLALWPLDTERTLGRV